MKHYHFIKFDPRLNKLTGCSRATLILTTLEYWFSKKPDGFYKFIEPCNHPLYKEGDSWSEELGCDRKCFARAWGKIGVKHKSRFAFEAVEDKFQGKLYASYYDRYTNRTFFIRNHDLANSALREYFPKRGAENNNCPDDASPISNSAASGPVGTGHNAPSHKDAKSTSEELSKDNSHASNEIVKKMLEIWITIVEEGKKQITLTAKRFAFLRRAFLDKFNSSLDQWKDFCRSVASSKFLMGEIKSSFKATLDWTLKFDVIQKIFEGEYGIGDRALPVALPSYDCLKREISSLDEDGRLKEFRFRCLERIGGAAYVSWFKNLSHNLDGGALSLVAPNGFCAGYLGSAFGSDLRILLEGLDKSILSLAVCVQEEPGQRKERFRVDRETKKSFFPGEPMRGHIPGQAQSVGQTPGYCLDQGLEERGGEGASEPVNSPTNPPMEPKPSPELAQTLDGQERLVTPSSFQTQRDKIIQSPSNDAIEAVGNPTGQLRDYLAKIDSPQLPPWLLELEVALLKPDGALLVLFNDPLAADYARSFYSEQILLAARQLWPNIKALSIQSHQPLDVVESPEKNKALPPKLYNPIRCLPLPSLVNPKGGLTHNGSGPLEQALQSLLSASSIASMGKKKGDGILDPLANEIQRMRSCA